MILITLQFSNESNQIKNIHIKTRQVTKPIYKVDAIQLRVPFN
jgi:hypothetical protein